MYAVVGLAVGYFSFRRDEPGLISPVFRPLIGDRVDGPWGKTIDVMAVLAVLFGVAVALGSAGLQLTADRKSTRLNSSHANISYAVFCLKENVCTLIWLLSLF